MSRLAARGLLSDLSKLSIREARARESILYAAIRNEEVAASLERTAQRRTLMMLLAVQERTDRDGFTEFQRRSGFLIEAAHALGNQDYRGFVAAMHAFNNGTYEATATEERLMQAYAALLESDLAKKLMDEAEELKKKLEAAAG